MIESLSLKLKNNEEVLLKNEAKDMTYFITHQDGRYDLGIYDSVFESNNSFKKKFSTGLEPINGGTYEGELNEDEAGKAIIDLLSINSEYELEFFEEIL